MDVRERSVIKGILIRFRLVFFGHLLSPLNRKIWIYDINLSQYMRLNIPLDLLWVIY
jgi:hypothetical protein